MMTELMKKLEDTKSALLSLGAERDTPSKQHNYLHSTVSAFQVLASQMLELSCGNNLPSGNEDIPFAAVLSRRSDAFRSELAHYGHEYDFMSATDNPDSEWLEPSIFLPSIFLSQAATDKANSKVMHVRKTGNLEGLGSILCD